MGYTCFRARLTFKMAVLAVWANWLHRQRLNGHSKKIWTKKTSKFRITKDPWTIAHENSKMKNFTCLGLV